MYTIPPKKMVTINILNILKKIFGYESRARSKGYCKDIEKRILYVG